MSGQHDFSTLYHRLRTILLNYEPVMQINQAGESGYQLDSPVLYKGREMMFGAVKVGKQYVSFHLMPIYVFPDLLDNISPELKKRMQGKSCFNFKKVDESLLSELEDLTRASYDRFRKQGMA